MLSAAEQDKPGSSSCHDSDSVPAPTTFACATMSRAFVKEPEGDAAGNDLPERPQSIHPNYITPRGLRCLQEKLEAMIARRTELEADKENLGARSELQILHGEIRFLQRRIEVADRKSTRLNSSHIQKSRMPSSA